MEGKGGLGFHGFQRFSPTPNAGLKLPENNINISNTTGDEAHGQLDSVCMVREQDRYMPIANVIRIMRRILPSHAKISDDAKETIQECVSEFISFITSEANERCQREQRKTITAEDVLWSMGKLGFDDYIPSLSVFLHRFRELEGERSTLRGDPMVKRGIDMLVANTPYGPAFHIAPHQGFLAPPMNANGNGNSGQVPVACYDPMAFAPYR